MIYIRRDYIFHLLIHDSAVLYYPSNSGSILGHLSYSFFPAKTPARRIINYLYLQWNQITLSLSGSLDFPLFPKVIATYKIWHSYFQHLPKLSRYSLGNKIDNSFLNFIESVYFALYSSKTNRKLTIEKMSKRLDILKIFLQLGWEVNLLDNEKYSAVSIPLSEIGKIIGEWKKRVKE